LIVSLVSVRVWSYRPGYALGLVLGLLGLGFKVSVWGSGSVINDSESVVKFLFPCFCCILCLLYFMLLLPCFGEIKIVRGCGVRLRIGHMVD